MLTLWYVVATSCKPPEPLVRRMAKMGRINHCFGHILCRLCSRSLPVVAHD